MSFIEKVDPEVSRAIRLEFERQFYKLGMIASENYASLAVMEAQGCLMTNKYAEGYPGRRYYGGCEYVDMAEQLAIERAKRLFGCEHVNVQPHSGTQANMAVYFAVLKPGDTIMGMNLSHGGHLSHGSPVNFSGFLFNVVSYGVNRETELIDFNEVEDIARKAKPKIIVAGGSSYPRAIDFKPFRDIADSVGAYLMADIAHPAGLIAAGLNPSPIPYSQFVTATTHKTLRGPRGGIIMCKEEFAKMIDSKVFPGVQGGPLMHVIAAKAVAFKEALEPSFIEYQKQVIRNAKTLADSLNKHGFRIVTGGTDTHMVLVDLRNMAITGKDAEVVLDRAGIVVNKNVIPFDPNPPRITSGIRIGTPALTTRGMKEEEMEYIAELINRVLKDIKNERVIEEVRREVTELCMRFPIYTETFPLKPT